MLAGCSESVSGPADLTLISSVDDAYFIRQLEKPGAVMEALFQGRVVKDRNGCLRLQPPTAATVIWPFGSTLEVRSEGEWVVGADGRDIGKIGSSFRFGGGVVPIPHGGIGFHEPRITEIRTRCPGRFWIVGETFMQ